MKRASHSRLLLIAQLSIILTLSTGCLPKRLTPTRDTAASADAEGLGSDVVDGGLDSETIDLADDGTTNDLADDVRSDFSADAVVDAVTSASGDTGDAPAPDSAIDDVLANDVSGSDQDSVTDIELGPCLDIQCPTSFVCVAVGVEPRCVCNAPSCNGCDTSGTGRACLKGEICDAGSCVCPGASVAPDPQKHNACSDAGYVCSALGAPCPPGFGCDANTGACVCQNASCSGCESAGRDCLKNETCTLIDAKRKCSCNGDTAYDPSKLDGCNGTAYTCGNETQSCGEDFICSGGACLCTLASCTNGCGETCRKDETCTAQNQCVCGSDPGCGLFGEEMDCISGKCQCGALGRPCPDGYRCQSGTCVCLGSVAGVLGEACKLSLDIYYGGVKMDNRFVLMYSLGASGRVYVVDAKRKHRRTIGASKYFGINGLQSAWVSTNGTIYAVPANAPKTVVRYDGTSWTTVHTAKQFLVSIWGWGSRIFAVGAAGTIVEFDGSQWTEKSVGTDGFFFVAGSSQNDVWALGPATYHYNGVQWSADIAPVWSVSSVSSAADGGVLVFGKSQSDVQQIVVRTGDTWVPIPLPPQMIDVDRVAIGLGGVVYAAGSCTSSNCVLRYSSDKWTTVLSEEDFGNSTRFMVPIGPGELLINGLSGSHGDTLRLLQAPSGDSGDWSRTWISTSPFNFSNGLASDAIYGARSSGVDNKPPYLIGFFNGVSWLPIEVESVSCSDCGNPTAVWPAAVDDIWVGGFYDAMIRRKGGVWTNYPLPHASTVCYGIWGSSPTNVYAIGFGPIGYVFQFNGTTWKDVTPGTETSFDTIWGSGPDDVYVSGTSAVYHFSAGKWEVVQGLSGDNFGKSLWGSGPKDVWGVGADLWRFDGQSWKVMTLPLGATAQSVRGTSATDVFLNGTNGVYRWDGQQWGPQLPYNELIWVDDVQMFTVDGFHIFR